MTLGKSPTSEDAFRSGTGFCRDHVSETSIYGMLYRESHRRFPDEAFADLFADIGRASVPPRIVSVVMVLQRLEGLSDREAAERITFDRLRLPAGRRRRAIETIIDAISTALVILSYDRDAAAWHARERARLTRLGRPPPFVDGQVAAVSAVNDLVLVTRNVRDFSGFTGLRIESWFSA